MRSYKQARKEVARAWRRYNRALSAYMLGEEGYQGPLYVAACATRKTLEAKRAAREAAWRRRKGRCVAFTDPACGFFRGVDVGAADETVRTMYRVEGGTLHVVRSAGTVEYVCIEGLVK